MKIVEISRVFSNDSSYQNGWEIQEVEDEDEN